MIAGATALSVDAPMIDSTAMIRFNPEQDDDEQPALRIDRPQHADDPGVDHGQDAPHQGAPEVGTVETERAQRKRQDMQVLQRVVGRDYPGDTRQDSQQRHAEGRCGFIANPLPRQLLRIFCF